MAANAFILLLLYMFLRNYSSLGRAILLPAGAGIAAFAVQALMFSEGAFLMVQLATYAGLFALLWSKTSQQTGKV